MPGEKILKIRAGDSVRRSAEERRAEEILRLADSEDPVPPGSLSEVPSICAEVSGDQNGA